jgi:hypothetical protein
MIDKQSNLTELHRIERELAELAKFPEMNPGPVCRLDQHATVKLANKAAQNLFEEPGLIGKSWFELCSGFTRNDWSRILEATTPLPLESEIGERCIMFTYVRSDTGDSVFAFGTDITERRDAERKVAKQAAILAEVARFPEMNPGPVLRTDFNGLILMANAAARKVFGEGLVGKPWRDTCPGITAEMWDRVLAATDPIPFEARVKECEYLFSHRCDAKSRLVFIFGADITRQRQTERALLQAEKMATLGTLAAGVAHELNNPAAATRRAADQLRAAFARFEDAHMKLASVELSPARRELLGSFEQQARERASHPGDLSAIARSDREAEVEEWLEAHDIQESWELAPALVSMGFDSRALEELEKEFHGEALPAVLFWLSSGFPVYALLHEIAQGSSRISEIVLALKGYSYLGQAPIQSVNLHEGLDNTLVILRNKIKAGITIHRQYGSDVPPLMAYGSELNQVWTNLLDNAMQWVERGRSRFEQHGKMIM